MKIAVATDVTTRGGVDTYIRFLIHSLVSQGHDVSLIMEARSGSDAGRDLHHTVEVVRIPLYRRWHDQAQILESCDAVLSSIDPEGVHVVTGSPRSCLILRERVIRRGINLVITESQVKESESFTPAERDEIRASYEAALGVIFVSRGNRAAMREALGGWGERARAQVVPNGVDSSGLSRLGEGGGQLRVPGRLVSVARLSPEKSLSTLIDAMALLPASLVSQLDIFGTGPEEEHLSARIKLHGLESRVRLLGWSRDVTRKLSSYDLFVLPSVAEGMPYALLEALAVGLPVVATDIPGNAEALDNGAAGVLVPIRQPHALAAAIQDSFGNTEATMQRVRAGIALVRREHDIDSRMAQVLGIWDRGLQSGR